MTERDVLHGQILGLRQLVYDLPSARLSEAAEIINAFERQLKELTLDAQIIQGER